MQTDDFDEMIHHMTKNIGPTEHHTAPRHVLETGKGLNSEFLKNFQTFLFFSIFFSHHLLNFNVFRVTVLKFFIQLFNKKLL